MTIHSQRAKNFLNFPQARAKSLEPKMKRYPGDEWVLWANLEWEGANVKNLSFFGELSSIETVSLEAVAALVKGRPLQKWQDLSLRECEAFLRDRNTEVSVEFEPQFEARFKKVLHWFRTWTRSSGIREFHFSPQKGAFRDYKLVDKIKLMRDFLGSQSIQSLYENLSPPELVDFSDLTAYLSVPYQGEKEKECLHELHRLAVLAFDEAELNIIPEP